MSLDAWAGLADRFAALAGETNLSLQVFPAEDAGAFGQSDYPLIFRFGGPPHRLDTAVGPSAGYPDPDQFLWLNRFRWLSWAAGVLLGPDDWLAPEAVWWRHVWRPNEPATTAGEAVGRRVLNRAGELSADAAWRLSRENPPATAGWLPGPAANWPGFQSHLGRLLTRFSDRTWEQERLGFEMRAFNSAAAMSVRQRVDPFTRDNATRTTVGGGTVWGELAAVEAFTRISESAAPLVPAELRLPAPLFPGWGAVQNTGDDGATPWYTLMFLFAPSFFSINTMMPNTACPGAVLRGSPFMAAAAAAERLAGLSARAAVSTFHLHLAAVNPWLTPDETHAALAAVEAAHAREDALAVPGREPERAERRKVGRPADTDHARDRKTAEAWASHAYSTYAGLARALGYANAADARRALDRHKKRETRAVDRPPG